MHADRIYKHGRFWVASLSMAAALLAIFGSPHSTLCAALHGAWDEWAVLAAGAYALFSLRREVRRS
jgi:hypothetical protein